MDLENEVFFMRVEWSLEGFAINKEKIGEYFNTLIAEKFDMSWEIYFSDYKPRMAVFVSKLSHCLYDILFRTQSGEWDVEIPLIISNHPDLEEVSKTFGIDYHIFKKRKGKQGRSREGAAEAA